MDRRTWDFLQEGLQSLPKRYRPNATKLPECYSQPLPSILETAGDPQSQGLPQTQPATTGPRPPGRTKLSFRQRMPPKRRKVKRKGKGVRYETDSDDTVVAGGTQEGASEDTC